MDMRWTMIVCIDHDPNAAEAKNPVDLRENYGFSLPQVNRVARLLQSHVQPLCAAWREIHGDF
jgi:hypothetical protein